MRADQVIWGRHHPAFGARHAHSRNMSSLIERCKLASGAAMCRKITRQSRWNLRRASDRAIPNQAPGMVGEGVETGRRASLVDEGTVRLSSNGESDRITQRSAVQIRPPQPMNATAEMQWRSPVHRSANSLEAVLRFPTSAFGGTDSHNL